MSKWETVKLKDLGDIVTGNTPKTSEKDNYNSNDIPFIKPSDFDDENILMKSTEFYISETARSKARILPVGSIIVTCIGIIGKTMITDRECAFNQQINAIIPNKNVNSRFIAYSLLNKKDALQKYANAAVVPIINKTEFSNIEIFLPPFEIQHQIAENLDKVTRTIDLCNAILEKLDLLVKARFVEMFMDKNLPLKTLDSLSLCKGEYGAASASIEYNENRPRYVRITDINDDGTLNDDYVSSINIEDDENYKLSYGDFLFARMGATVGKTYAFLEGNQIFAGYLIRYKLNQELITPRYLFVYTKLEEYSAWVRLNQTGAAQPGINAKKYGSLQIPVAPLSLQNQFSDFVEQTDKTKSAVKQVLEKAEMLKKALMQEYFG